MFYNTPGSLEELLAALEHLSSKPGDHFLYYREVSMPVRSTCAVLTKFLQNQDLVLAAETGSPSQIEDYVANMGCAWGEWASMQQRRRNANSLDALPIDIAILGNESLLEVFERSGLKKIQEDEERDGEKRHTAYFFRQMLDQWRQWNAKGVKGIPRDLAHCFTRLYGSEPDEGRRVEARQRIQAKSAAGYARAWSLPVERLRRLTETGWELTDIREPLENFWLVIEYVRENGGHLLGINQERISVRKLANIQHAIGEHQLRMREIDRSDVERLGPMAEELGRLYARLAMEMGAAYRRDWSHLQWLDEKVLAGLFAGILNRMFVKGVCEQIRDPKEMSGSAVGETPLQTKETIVSYFLFVMEQYSFLVQHFDLDRIPEVEVPIDKESHILQ